MEKTKLRLEQSTHDSEISTENIDEQRIREIIRKFVLDGHIGLDEKELIFEIIKMIKCDMSTAKSIVQKMNELGMKVCHHWRLGYTIRKFADMRGYVTDEEFKQSDKRILEKMKKEDKREAKFMEKYGADKSKWSDDTWDEYEYGD